MTQTVAIGGLGAIGLKLARALDAGVDGLQLIAVAARDLGKAAANLRDFRTPPRLVPLAELAEADIVVEAAPAAVFEQIAGPAIEAGRIFVPASVGALLPRMELIRRARRNRRPRRGADRRAAWPRRRPRCSGGRSTASRSRAGSRPRGWKARPT